MFLRINLIKISIRIINRTKNGIPKPSPRPKPFFENELLNNNRNEDNIFIIKRIDYQGIWEKDRIKVNEYQWGRKKTD